MSTVLLPAPRSLRRHSGSLPLPASGVIALLGDAAALEPIGRRLADGLKTHGRGLWSLGAVKRPDALIELETGNRSVADAEGYRLTVSGSGIKISAKTPHGVFHGVSTLLQLVQQHPRRLPCLAIADAPDFPHRGVMIDVSRDKVPTLATLKGLIELLASWKINQIQLYVEHTFAYRNHRTVWKKASPLTGNDILELDAFCRDRFIELVPNQNSFGHLTRWLVHPQYRPLAEAPHGCDTAWGWFKEPFTINPRDPRSLRLLQGLFDEYLPHFSSRQFNVGCDETMDLGKVRNKKLAARIGVGRLYLDFLLKIEREVRRRGRVMQFWGDVILHHPALVRKLPRNIVALEWGYEWDHPFAKECAQFAKSRIPFYVCPGTSTWNALLGRTDNAIGNIRNAAVQGLRRGAIGILNTDWGDGGHWQYLPSSYLGYAWGAETSWCLAAADARALPAALDRFAFHDEAGVMGRAAWDLGNVYKALGPRTFNASGLVRTLLTKPEDILKNKKQKPAGFRRALAALARAAAPLGSARMRTPDAQLTIDEYRNAIRLSRHGALRGLLAHTTAPRRVAQMKRELRRDLAAIIREHRRLWLARNRSGGLADSVRKMSAIAQAYK